MNQGHYIIDKRVLFKKGSQEKLLLFIKEKSGITWGTFAKRLGVSEYTIKYDWRREKSTMPLSLLKNMLSIYPYMSLDYVLSEFVEKILEENWGQKKTFKKIKIPVYDENIAEFIGTVIGDGNISKKEIVISSEYPFELKYAEYIKSLVNKLFGICGVFSFHSYIETVIYLRFRSVKLVKYINDMGLKCGKKISNKTTIPKWIFGNEIYLKHCLRGLFDTDGGIFNKQNGYKRALIEFETKSETLSRDITLALKNLGFSPSKSNLNIRIQSQSEICRFFREIGSSNPKNKVRFKSFIENGIVPNKIQTRHLLNKMNTL